MKFILAMAALAAASCAQAAEPAACPPPQKPSGGTRAETASGNPSGLLLVGNKGEDTLSLIDLATGSEICRLGTGRAPHEIAVSPDGRQAAVVAYGGNSIDIFDLGTRTKLRTVSLGSNEGPHGLVWLEDGRLVATTERARTLTIVDTNKGDSVSAIATDQQGTHMVAVSPDRGRAYTANIGSGTVSVIDLKAGRKLRDIATGGEPEAIVLSPDGATLWVGDLKGARVQAFDTRSFERLAELPTGAVPIRLVATPDGKWVISSNAGAGTLTMIDARRREVVGEVRVSGSPEAAQVTIILSSDGKRLYAAETGRDQVAEIDLETRAVRRRLRAGRNGDGLAVTP
ncbi:MAG TPA: beta-propeller fold lactonase family protein [Allosphingosinicella sp.]